MSNINPQSIDGTYPIAGQDNNSQGFRDNFTNTVNNFTFAAAELTDLQQNAVLKAALGSVGQTGTPTNDLNYAYLTHAQLIGTVETKNTFANVTSGTFTVDWATGHFQRAPITGTTATLAFAATWPASNLYTKLRLQIDTYSNAVELTLPSAVSVNVSSIQGNFAGNKINLPAGSVYLFEFSTWDGGSTIAIEDVLRNYDITANGEISTFTTANIQTLNIGSPLANVRTTGNVIGGLARFASINSTPIGNATPATGAFTTLTATNLTTSGNVTINDPVSGSNSSSLVVNGTIQSKYWNYTNVVSSSDSISLMPGGDSLKLVQISANLAIGYNTPIVAGYKVEYTVQNTSSGNVWVNLPNANTNLGKGNVFVLGNSYTRFVFTSFGANAAMVTVSTDGRA